MYFEKNQNFFCFGGSIRLLGQSSEVECNAKMNISFFDNLGGLLSFFCISVNVCCSDYLADHQKLNIIQKQTFHFLMTKGAFFCFFVFWLTFVTRITLPIIRS